MPGSSDGARPLGAVLIWWCSTRLLWRLYSLAEDLGIKSCA